MKLSELHTLTGGLSKPSKMPCHGYSIPASACKTGTKLRAIPNSTCSSCYACKGRYMFPNVQDALHRRLDALQDSNWVEWMVALIGRKEKSGYFRWHDSGDLQSMEHLTGHHRDCKPFAGNQVLAPNQRDWADASICSVTWF